VKIPVAESGGAVIVVAAAAATVPTVNVTATVFDASKTSAIEADAAVIVITTVNLETLAENRSAAVSVYVGIVAVAGSPALPGSVTATVAA
jgi:hypothetical protein